MDKQADIFRLVARSLPRPIRRLLGYCWDYAFRLGRWYSILGEIRGASLRDQLVLLASAVASPFTSLRRFGQWQDPVLLKDAAVHVSGIGKFLLRHHTDDLWHVLPSREPSVLRTICSRLHRGAVFVDAGANIGVYTVLAGHAVGSDGRVIAVEMMPEAARILRGHVSLNALRNVAVVERALAEQSGKEVVARVPAGQHGQASIAPGVAAGGTEVRVVTTTLSEVLAGFEQIALMKMDLEGAEEFALEGAGEALKRIVAVIFEDWGGEHLSEIFRASGFSVERLDGNNCLAINLTSAR